MVFVVGSCLRWFESFHLPVRQNYLPRHFPNCACRPVKKDSPHADSRCVLQSLQFHTAAVRGEKIFCAVLLRPYFPPQPHVTQGFGTLPSIPRRSSA